MLKIQIPMITNRLKLDWFYRETFRKQTNTFKIDNR